MFTGPKLINDGIFTGPKLINDGMFTGPKLINDGMFTGPKLIKVGIFRGPKLIKDGIFRGPKLIKDGMFRGENSIFEGIQTCMSTVMVGTGPKTINVGITPKVMNVGMFKGPKLIKEGISGVTIIIEGIGPIGPMLRQGKTIGGSTGGGGGVIDGIKKGGIEGILGIFISKIGLSSGGFISES